MSAPLLLIDVGNSRVKWATAEVDGEIVPEGELHTRLERAIARPDDGIQLEGELPTADFTPEFIGKIAKLYPGHDAVLSSVVPKLVPDFLDAFQARIHQVTADSPALGLLFQYPKASELGADRLAAAAAVREEGIWPAIIVQCGTATAFSYLDENAKFRGGIIAPGPHAQLASLIGATAQLPSVDLRIPTTGIGTSTEDAIRLGVILNYHGGVNAILRHMCRRSKPPLTSIILTGGNASFLTDSLEFPFTLRPLLVFEGLRIIGLRAFKDV